MAADQNSDVLPILSDAVPSFAQAMRGYDRAQVDSYVAQLDVDLRQALAERDAIAARSRPISPRSSASAQAQIESLRRQLRAATERITADNVEEHVAQILKGAQADAASAAQRREGRGGDPSVPARWTPPTAPSPQRRPRRSGSCPRRTRGSRWRTRPSVPAWPRSTRARRAVEKELTESRARAEAEEARLTARPRRSATASTPRRRPSASGWTRRHRRPATGPTRTSRSRCARGASPSTRRSTRTARRRRSRQPRRVATAKATAARLVEEAHAEVRRLKTIREESHHYLRALHGRLGDSLAESEKAGEALDARARRRPDLTSAPSGGAYGVSRRRGAKVPVSCSRGSPCRSCGRAGRR